jgi:glucose-6-phosphate isomerase
MAAAVDRLRTFASGVRRDGFADVVLLGMGGSSLAPEVLRAVVGVSPGWPRFHMLDSTDPEAVRAVDVRVDRTLFILASKSGTTIEPNSLAAHFGQALRHAGVARWADHFIAITDEGTTLARRATAEGFREAFINPADIGGRYSAISYFGLVPAFLMGQDGGALIEWAAAMMAASESSGDPPANPAVALGLAMAAGAQSGRDKLTLVMTPALEPFALWIEQLVAESTGKQGLGVVPIAGERPGARSWSRADRLFVAMRFAAEKFSNEVDLEALKAADRPVIEIELPEPAALGAEFMRWEIATAIAGALLGINPFDEPNVQQAKDATRVLLDRHRSSRSLDVAPPDEVLAGGVTLTLSAAARHGLGAYPRRLLTLLSDRDYFALLAFLGPDPVMAQALQALRSAVSERTNAPTMFGYGPRYLHSTGQLHKGGPDAGVFLIVSSSPRQDLPIPGESFSFGTLELAQALGDFASLNAAGRRALHVHLPAPEPDLIHRIEELIVNATGNQ